MTCAECDEQYPAWEICPGCHCCMGCCDCDAEMPVTWGADELGEEEDD